MEATSAVDCAELLRGGSLSRELSGISADEDYAAEQCDGVGRFAESGAGMVRSSRPDHERERSLRRRRHGPVDVADGAGKSLHVQYLLLRSSESV